MTENIDHKTEQYLYEIVQSEECIRAAGWQIVRVGLHVRFLCHAATGKILTRFNQEIVDDLDDLTNIIYNLQEYTLSGTW